MSKTLRNKELTMIILSQFHCHMLTISRGAFANIYCYIEYSTLHTSHQLALCKRRPLEMQATHYTITAHTLIVLAELYLVAHQWLHLLFKLSFAETLEEIATSISKQARLNDEYAIYICLYYFHFLYTFYYFYSLIHFFQKKRFTFDIIHHFASLGQTKPRFQHLFTTQQ